MAQAGGLTTEQPQIPPEYPWRQQDSETKCSKCGGKRAISCTLREARVHTWEQNQHCKINKTLRPSLKNLTRIPQGSSKTLFIFTRSSAESILSGTPVAFYLRFFFLLQHLPDSCAMEAKGASTYTSCLHRSLQHGDTSLPHVALCRVPVRTLARSGRWRLMASAGHSSTCIVDYQD